LYSSFPSAVPGQFDRACRTLTKSLHAPHSSGSSCAPSHFHGTWGVSVPSDIPQNHFNLTPFADRNPGTCLYMIWTCLNQFVNSIIWRGNAITGAPVWCDISSKFVSWTTLAISAASLCINIPHRLCEDCHHQKNGDAPRCLHQLCRRLWTPSPEQLLCRIDHWHLELKGSATLEKARAIDTFLAL